MALFALGIPIGSALGIVFGGLIAARMDWRVAFIALGVAGVLLAPIYRLVVRDPRPAAPVEAQSAGAVFAILARKPSFWLMSLPPGSARSWPMASPSGFRLSSPAVSISRGRPLTAFRRHPAGRRSRWRLARRHDQRSPVAHAAAAYAAVPALTYALCLPVFLLALSSSVTAASILLASPPRSASPGWTGGGGDQRPGPIGHALDCCCAIPVHRQPDRPWPWHAGDRLDLRCPDPSLRRRSPSLFHHGDLQPLTLSPPC